MNPSGRWGDERLDDFFARFRRVEEIADRVPVMQEQLKTISEDTSTSRRNIHALRNDFTESLLKLRKEIADAEERREERHDQERKDEAMERKKDRRWLVGTILSAAGLIVAAIAVLQGFMG